MKNAILAALILMSGCATLKGSGPQVLTCVESDAATTVEKAILIALDHDNTWASDLEQLGLEYGESTFECALAVVVKQIEASVGGSTSVPPPPPSGGAAVMAAAPLQHSSMVLMSRAHAFQASHPVVLMDKSAK